jgi:hypothetical protein
MPDSRMGDFHLTDEEAETLADYLMTFRSRPPDDAPVPQRTSLRPEDKA